LKGSVLALILVLIAAVSLAGFLELSSPDFRNPSPETLDQIVVAYSPYESTALFWIAEDRDLFHENGLNLTLRRYESGAASLEGVVKGEADIAVGVTEFPLVREVFRNSRVSAFGNIDKGSFIYIVGRRDRGIRNVSDLRGKRVGSTTGTIAEFYLGRFLTLHGMGMGDITPVEISTPEGWVNAVAEGDIDAISTAQPYANAARDRLGENAVVWQAQSGQPLFALVISSDDWMAQHPGTAVRFLRALAGAEEYAAMHPSEAQAIVQKRLDLDPGYMDTVWQQNRFSLSLDQSLILAMEDEARWLIANGLVNTTAVPDVRCHISTGSLEEVRPGSVNII